ncbi:MAG: S9 family peptidase [Polyangiaceae bacterium]|nr:S9 family peptidase [Polyangiaceae bacterium]
MPATPAPPIASAPSPAPAPGLAYPATRKVDVAEAMFGVTVRDPYRWLEDGASPEVQAWVAAQDKVARGYLASLPGRDAVRDRLAALAYIESASPPTRRGGRVFYSRKAAGKEKRTVYWKQGDAGEERVLLDSATLSPDGSTGLGDWVPSHDGKLVAYVAHPNNADAGEIRVRDVATGKDSAADVIGGAKYAHPQWTSKGDAFYYVGLPTDPKIPGSELPGHSEVKLHRIGTPASSDEVVFPRLGDPETELETTISRDGRWLTVSVIRGSSTISELHLRDLRRPKSPWIALVKGHDGTMAATVYRDHIYLRTTDGAPRGRVFRVDPAKPARDQWKEIVPEVKDAVLEDARVIGGHLALTYVKDARSELEVRTLDGARAKGASITLPGIGSSSGLLGEPDDDTAYYIFTSFTSPGSIYEVSIKTGASKLWYSLKAPIDPSPYEVEQVTYASKDGTRVPMFVVHRKGAPKDGSTPFILTGYGGFNISMTPYFQSDLYVWLEAGGGVAMPSLRGGGEYGEAWHQGGMLAKKQNVFDDFIGAAEHLIKSGMTRPERLAIYGGSNGGLLVGAAMIQRPDLFRAVICAVPVLDMIRYPLFGDGKTWIGEYGSPSDEAMFKALMAYSPYHNVKPGTAYPAVLMASADADDRVAPLHAWKTTAALQAATTGGRPVLLRVEKSSGHGGADKVKSRVERGADVIAFALHEMGFGAQGADRRPGAPSVD